MPLELRHHARCACGVGGGGARPFAFAGSPRHYERDRPFAIEHLALDLSLDVANKSAAGEARLTLRRVDPRASRVELDAVGFRLAEVLVDGAPAEHVYDGKVLSVAVAEAAGSALLTVRYAVTPRRGLYFIEPDEHHPHKPRQVWTQCQEEDARHFVPCHDKPHQKMTTEISVTVPAGWYALSNGHLESQRAEPDGRARFHWRMEEPHSSYLLTIAAGELAEITDSVDGLPLQYLFPKGREDDARRTFARTPEMVRLLGKLLGVPYPWNKYSQVVVSDFIFGGMENTTATTLYEHVLLDERAAIDVTSDDLIVHELAHQWFGDFVTCRDWSEGWLNEGFATYCEHVWREHALGADEYDYGLSVDLHSYLSEASGRYRRAIVCQDYDAPLDLFDRHLYEKGALVLHVLRTELGAELFWRGVNVYLARNAKGVVETRDLARALEEVSGRGLGRFFDLLVHRPGHPELSVDVSWSAGVLVVAVKQTQHATDGVPSVFEVPLVVEVARGGERRRERVELRGRVDTFALPCPTRPDFVVVDPDGAILGDVTVRAPLDMLRAQLVAPGRARTRWLAARSLAVGDDPASVDALAARLADVAEAWMVRAECAEALGKVRAPECERALLAHASAAHPKVRRAVASALGAFRTRAASEALAKLVLSDASYLVAADAARALGRTRQTSGLDTLLDVADRKSWADVVSAGALDGLAELREERAVPHLTVRTRYGHPTRARRAAIMAVSRLAPEKKTRELLEDLLDDADPHLRIDVVRALVEVGDARARGALRARLDRDLDPRVRRRIREALRDLADVKKGAERATDRIEKLEGELQELRARLTRLDARLPAAGAAAEAATPDRGKRSRAKPAPPAGRATTTPTQKRPAPTKHPKKGGRGRRR